MHILGAIALMGGTIFVRFALAPTVVTLDPATKQAIHDQVRSKWSKFVMLAAALLLISGIVNLGLAARYEYERVFGMSYHMIVGIKFILALPIFFVASVLAGRSEMAKKFQANAKMWMNFNLALALVMVLIGGTLKFVKRQPKAQKAQNASVSTDFRQIASKMLPFRAAAE